MQLKKDYKIVVTSGPTREFIDPIRYISNPSTGKMGYYIAKAAVNSGFPVTYIAGPVDSEFAKVDEATNISVLSTQDMLDAVLKSITNNCVLIMAAAPADYRPAKRYEVKMKKTDSPDIHLVPNPDILQTVNLYRDAKGIRNLHLIGFAAETHDTDKYALEKLQKKNLDMIFLNDLTRKDSGFGVNTNQLTVFYRNGKKEVWPPMAKEKLGYQIIREIEQWLPSL
ncbi:MAG: phosphopantothenoylcysteine decarboxylase [Candidatus Hydrogenedentota bacterium]|nr:MAG: phosphopantothenoylcysteine decarboxylase [Candidatus Hydrogenedentota bacterium]